MENPIRIDDLGVPLFSETPINIYNINVKLATRSLGVTGWDRSRRSRISGDGHDAMFGGFSRGKRLFAGGPGGPFVVAV